MVPLSNVVMRSRFSFSSFSLSLTALELEKLVFFSPPAPAPVRYSCAIVWEPEPAGVQPNAPLISLFVRGSARAYQLWYNIFSLTTNQHQPGLSAQKPTSEQAK